MPLFPVESRRVERACDLGTTVLAGRFCVSRRAERRELPDTRLYEHLMLQTQEKSSVWVVFHCHLSLFLQHFSTNKHTLTQSNPETNASRLRRKPDRLTDRKLGEYLDARRSSPFLTLPFHPPCLYLWSAPVSCKEQQQERTITFGPQRGGRW